MATNTIVSTLQHFQVLLEDLETEKDQNEVTRGVIQANAFVVIEEGSAGPLQMERGLESETDQVLLRISELKLNILNWKINKVGQLIVELQGIQTSGRATYSPKHLLPSAFDEWLNSDENLTVWQLQLLEIQQFLISLKRRRKLLTHQVSAYKSLHREDIVHNSILTMKMYLSNFAAHISSDKTIILQEVISPSRTPNKKSVVSKMVSAYVDECIKNPMHDNQAVPDPQGSGSPAGGHPERYRGVVDVLVGYLMDNYGRRYNLNKNEVYLTVEDHLMPKVKNYSLCFVTRKSDDQKLLVQYEKFKDVTLEDICEKGRRASQSLVPFVAAITTLKSSYFTPNPTRKLHVLMMASKCVLDELSLTFKASDVDADLFLDVWVYCILKAKLRDLATTIAFMQEYSDPSLCLSEGGYTLTTTYSAMVFIMNMNEDSLHKPESSCFITCEVERYEELCSKKNSPMEIVAKEVLKGYKMAVLPGWIYEKKRCFSSFLIETNKMEDTVNIAVIRPSQVATGDQIRYINEGFTTPPFREVTSVQLKEGIALVLPQDTHTLSDDYVVIPSDMSFKEAEEHISYCLSLIRLGCQSINTLFIPPSPSAPQLHHSSFTSSQSQPDQTTTRDQPQLLVGDVKSANTSKSMSLKVERRMGPETLSHSKFKFENPISEDDERDTESINLLYKKLFEVEFLKKLENNFIINHLNSQHCEDVKSQVKEIIREAQIHLKLLNYFSHLHKPNGVYCDYTVAAVKRFQEGVNLELQGSPLPQNGYLSVHTRHRLRGKMLDVSSKMLWFGFRHFPDLLDLSEEDTVQQCMDYVGKLQEELHLSNHCRRGVFCKLTVEEIDKKFEQMQRCSTTSDQWNVIPNN